MYQGQTVFAQLMDFSSTFISPMRGSVSGQLPHALIFLL